MAEKEQFSLDSLRKVAGDLSSASEEGEVVPPSEEEPEPAKEEVPLPAPAKVALIPEKSDDLEEYNEFPRLEKHKTYDLEVLKKTAKPLPVRDTLLRCQLTDLSVLLKDCELYEAYANTGNLRPILLKNSHAIFNGLASCDSVTFIQDNMGSFTVKVKKGEQIEELKLGCLVKFEFVRMEFSNLVLSSRDIDGEIAVVGAPCPIEFTYDPKSRTHETETASTQRLSTNRDEISQANKEAGNYSWNL